MLRILWALQPGERVTLIKKAAETLSPQAWGDIDLVLDQFGFPILDDWQGDGYGYVVEMLKHSDDDAS